MARKSTLEASKEAKPFIELAAKNRFQTFTFEETAQLFGWGRNVPSALAALGAPVVAKRFNPDLLLQWIAQNPSELTKLRNEDEE